MDVKLISTTQISSEMAAKLPPELQNAEGLMAYCARVSSVNQENPDYEKLLRYCASHAHWSVFELADMTVEITTSRGISAQLLRHRSFSFQEFSQRYSKVEGGVEIYQARRQDLKNRQNSIDDVTDQVQFWFNCIQQENQQAAFDLYEKALHQGIAKEQARFLLPIGTTTKLYMKGSVRSWITYLKVRTDPSTQKEHRDIADAIKVLFIEQFPVTAKAMEWT